MRKLLVIMAMLTAGLFVSSAVHAQLGISLNFNVARQPVWGPTGYDHVEYYYLPDIEAYYNVPQQLFYYHEDGRWVSSARLPARYRDYDFYRAHKVVVNERTPYLHHETYRALYSSRRDFHDQESIRDSRDSKYFVNRGHPRHDAWVREHGDDAAADAPEETPQDTVAAVGDDEMETADDSVADNISDQPMWGPTGYDRVDFYYIPDIDAYYSVDDREYIYKVGSDWRHTESLPPSYGYYNPYNSYKVVLNEPYPYDHNAEDRDRYGSFRGRRGQPMIRDSHEE